MHRDQGFTLIELMIAMVISLIVMSTIYSVYYSQQKSYVAQEQVAMMQQNLRAAMNIMTRDIRMAGYDPTGAYNTGITEAESGSLTFTMLNDESGTTKAIRYFKDSDNLKKDSGGGGQVVAEGIEALDFVYLNVSGTTTSSLTEIRSIQATMVARTVRPDQGYNDSNEYKNQQNVVILPTPDDGYRRRVLTREIKCRNLGL